jgi:hypothetical protein
VVAQMAIFRSPSFFDGAEVSFQFYGCNRITWHLHLLEPCGQGSVEPVGDGLFDGFALLVLFEHLPQPVTHL